MAGGSLQEHKMAERSLKAGESTQGALVIVRPSELAKAGTTGVVAEGIYEGTKPNKFDATKNDYFVRSSDGTLYIINQTQGLSEQLGQLEASDNAKVRIEYDGKLKTKNGKGYHSFNVFVIT